MIQKPSLKLLNIMEILNSFTSKMTIEQIRKQVKDHLTGK